MYREGRTLAPARAGASELAGGSQGLHTLKRGGRWLSDSPRPSRQRKPRRPKAGNEIRPSPLRPHVLAEDRILKWRTPAGWQYRTKIASVITQEGADAVFELVLAGLEPDTAKNYGAGLLRFTQFCDELGIQEEGRMPAPEYLLAAFLARHAGTVQHKTMGNWLSGLRIHHAVNGASWSGDMLVKYAKKGAKKLNPPSLPKRPPVTLEHMEALLNGLDLANTFDAAVFALASTAFWGCRRLGELLIPSRKAFRPDRHVARSAKVGYRSIPNGTRYAIFHIPWTKTTASEGADIILTGISGFLDPVTALRHHLNINSTVPGVAPLFAFEDGEDGAWRPMTRDVFLRRCNTIWSSTGMENLSGHCFRIGGATELLLRGIHPDVVSALGSWKSRAFLDYWRKIESIIPLFISQASDPSRLQLMRTSMDNFRRRHSLREQ
ncbi:hypothetical protein OH76DRAFT_1351914 [Lentinus brumalis]|uniref:DNA breaking-rejoining enzyme n=1 Tax=Lentinus brumalis TaxID=2498619 RepID=A0A371D8E3_9APHY|nr:hypothetical protein OH76DRAFT_1351914 [Polyporus brumalis]